MPKLQITTAEAELILDSLRGEGNTLFNYIAGEMEGKIPTIHGLPTKEYLADRSAGDDGVECLDKWRNPYIVYHTEEEGYCIFESLGEDAGSDDDPIKEFDTYEEMQAWWEQYNIDGIIQ